MAKEVIDLRNDVEVQDRYFTSKTESIKTELPDVVTKIELGGEISRVTNDLQDLRVKQNVYEEYADKKVEQLKSEADQGAKTLQNKTTAIQSSLEKLEKEILAVSLRSASNVHVGMPGINLQAAMGKSLPKFGGEPNELLEYMLWNMLIHVIRLWNIYPASIQFFEILGGPDSVKLVYAKLGLRGAALSYINYSCGKVNTFEALERALNRKYFVLPISICCWRKFFLSHTTLPDTTTWRST